MMLGIFIFMMIASGLALLFLYAKDSGKKGRKKKFRGRKIKKKFNFTLPKRFEIGMIAGAIFTLFFTDVMQNKFLDLGVDYEVHIIESITFNAVTGFWVGVLIYHLFLFSLIWYSFSHKGTSMIWDWIMSIIAVFGMFVIVLGAIAGIYTETIPFFAWQLKQITFYHVFGIFPQIIAMFYFAFTD